MATDNKPLVSVIMNCYNSSEYLREAIDSVFSQTYKNWEIIFWDNQSTDQSAEIFKSYSDERCKYFYAPSHTKLGEARNLAVAKAEGEWLGFLDCDDIWFPEKLIRQVEIINEEGKDLGVVYGKTKMIVSNEGGRFDLGKYAFYHNKLEEDQKPEGYIFDVLLFLNPISLCSALINIDALHKVGLLNNSFKMAEDYDLFLKISYSYKFRSSQEFDSYYRVHNTNQSHDKKIICYLEMLESISQFKHYKKSSKALSYWYAKLAGAYLQEQEYYKFIQVALCKADFWSLFLLAFRRIKNKLFR